MKYVLFMGPHKSRGVEGEITNYLNNVDDSVIGTVTKQHIGSSIDIATLRIKGIPVSPSLEAEMEQKMLSGLFTIYVAQAGDEIGITRQTTRLCRDNSLIKRILH